MCFSKSAGMKRLWPKEQRGEKILESMESLDLVLVNTFSFNKNEERLITYKSGGNSSQIDFIMTRRKCETKR